KKFVRNLSQRTAWADSIYANPNDFISFSIKVTAENAPLNNLIVKDVLPQKIIYKGGISGNMIFPMALRSVFELYRKVSIPIIGLGGIDSGRRALEMIFAGASAVSVGTASIIFPDLPVNICNEIYKYMKSKNKKFSSLIGICNEKEKYKK
ncbi:MAG: hypothetical protein N2115_07910, partial [bacterium]|nr:hypothetical protein [bacterium]